MCPLFVCNNPKCQAVENTALGQYWGEKEGNKLCSECARGKWHNAFPKRIYDPKKWDKDGDFLSHKTKTWNITNNQE